MRDGGFFGACGRAHLLGGLSERHPYKRGTQCFSVHLHARSPQIVIGPHLHVGRLQSALNGIYIIDSSWCCTWNTRYHRRAHGGGLYGLDINEMGESEG